MACDKKVSNAVIRRLPKYYRYLSTLQQMGISRVSSKDLSQRLGITASQVRQDFFHFGGFGLQGYGYDVASLLQEIGCILGLDRTYNMVLIGAGNLGQAIAKHSSFEKRGFQIVGVFDANPHLIGKQIKGIDILHYDQLEDFVKRHAVDIAVITVPRIYAQDVMQRVVDLGIKGIWNFASVELDVPEDVSIENIHLSESLMTLAYEMKRKKEKLPKKTRPLNEQKKLQP